MRYLIPMLLLTWSANAQIIDTIGVCQDKNVYVVFDHDVALVDLGTKLDYAFQIKDNIVMLKGLRPQAPPTSLMVKTTDARIHVWIIAYRQTLKTILISAGKQKEGGHLAKDNTMATIPDTVPVATQTTDKPKVTEVPISPHLSEFLTAREKAGNRDASVSDAIVAGKIQKFFSEKKAFRDLGEIGNGIYFSLMNIRVDDKYVYIKLSLHNTSSIAFDLDVMYFERNQGKSIKKREARMKSHMPAVFRETIRTVHPSTEETMVYVLQLFAFHERDKLLVKVNERGGVRSLQFEIPAGIIINAKSI